MTKRPFSNSPSYQAVIRGLLRLHKLALTRQDESEEADLVRESMIAPWEDLSTNERERITGLSKDLYEISDHPDRTPEPMDIAAQGKLKEAYDAIALEEWDKALELLRLAGKYVPAASLSLLRGTIWRAAGDEAIAAEFFEHQSQSQLGTEEIGVELVGTLRKKGS